MGVLPPWNPAREAERLRAIMETLARVQPNLSISEAVPMIFEVERDAAQRERVETVEAESAIVLPDTTAPTIKKFIDLQPDIQGLITGGKKIDAIKAVRARAVDSTGSHVGLRDAKEGVEYWDATGSTIASRPVTAPVSASSGDIADWLDKTAHPAIQPFLDQCIAAHPGIDVSAKIRAIKETRGLCMGITLKEAKDGVELYLKRKVAPL